MSDNVTADCNYDEEHQPEWLKAKLAEGRVRIAERDAREARGHRDSIPVHELYAPSRHEANDSTRSLDRGAHGGEFENTNAAD